VGEGDGAADPIEPPTTPTSTPTTTTDTTVPPPTTPADEFTDTANWNFAVEPGCNAIYDLAVYAEADPGGPAAPGDPGTVSDAVEVERLRVSLVPRPASVEAVVGGDRRVTVRWTAPAAWTDADGAPDDATGFRVQRAGADRNFVTVGETPATESSVVDDDLVGVAGGRYTYRVLAMRRGATGTPVASTAVEATVDLAPAAPATTTAPTRGGGGGAVSRGGGVVLAPPTTEFDPGFQEQLPYEDDVELGAPDAVPPADIGIFEEDGPIGSGILVPSAVALCLAVWAGHLRHLSHRASRPT
jgi:hypothetical protein